MAGEANSAGDLEEIKKLKARYFRALDTKDWKGFGALFTHEAVIDTSAAGGHRVVGIELFVNEYLRPTLADSITVHHGHTPEIEFTGPTTATGIWAMEDRIWWNSGRHVHGFGHYHDTYELVGSSWLITSVRLTRLHQIWDELSIDGGDAR